MQLKLDLHVHSQYSPDGRMTLEEIAAEAYEKGLDGVAVCDHDRVYTGPVLINGVMIIPGAELTTQYGHLLGLFLKEPIIHESFSDAVDGIRKQSGLAVIAHPFQHSANHKRIDPILPLLDGIEVWNSRADRKNPNANRMAQELAQEHGLLISAGSDAHVRREVGGGFLLLNAQERSLEAVHAALLRGDGTASGTRGRSTDVARSQFTKLKKTQAPMRRYVKWAAFAVKCAAEDMRH